jgi:hypothetical protein
LVNSVPCTKYEESFTRCPFAFKKERSTLYRALKTELGRIDGSHAVKRLNQEALSMTEALLVMHSVELPLRDPARAAFFVVHMVEGIVDAALLEGCAALTEPGFTAALSAAVMGMLRTGVAREGLELTQEIGPPASV